MLYRNKRRQYQPQMQYGANGFQNGANRIQNDANGFQNGANGFQNGAIGFQDGGFQPQINPPHVRTQIRKRYQLNLCGGGFYLSENTLKYKYHFSKQVTKRLGSPPPPAL